MQFFNILWVGKQRFLMKRLTRIHSLACAIGCTDCHLLLLAFCEIYYLDFSDIHTDTRPFQYDLWTTLCLSTVRETKGFWENSIDVLDYECCELPMNVLKRLLN